MASLLQGSAFVTGAASGLGEHTAHAFAKHGISKLAITDIDLDGLNRVAASIEKQWSGVEVLALQMDVRKGRQVKATLSQIVALFGRLDIAVNNAGVTGQSGQIHTLDDADWEKVLGVNLNGVHHCQKEELGIMVQQEDLGPRRGRGTIINVSSMYGIIGPQSPIHVTAYSTAKHAVMGMTKADAASYAGFNIRINAICPGYVKTPMINDGQGIEMEAHPLHQLVQNTPLRRLGLPEEIADSIVFLASPMSSFVNGVGLVADGGFSSS